MMNNKIIKGIYTPPGDKSISHRIIILCSQAIGESVVTNLLESEDVLHTVKVMKKLGSNIKNNNSYYTIHGVPVGGLFEPLTNLYFGNSGTSIRLIMGLISSNNINAVLTGDKSLSNRPMTRVTSHLSKIGTLFKLTKNNFLPINIIGSKNPIPLNYDIKIPSAQIKSAIILSALNTNGQVKIKEFSSTRDHTEKMLKSMGYSIRYYLRKNFRFISMDNKKDLKPIKYSVPGDPSSAAFMITAACLRPGSKLIIKNMLYNPTRIGFIDTLKKMNGNIKIKNKRIVHNEIIVDLIVEQKKYLKSVTVSSHLIPQQIDEIPILSIAASYAKGHTIFKNLKELTVKESDRLMLIYENLKKIGVDCKIDNFDLHIYGEPKLKKGGAKIVHDFDHRILMSFYVSDMICNKKNIILDKSCVKTSYPGFFKDIKGLLF